MTEVLRRIASRLRTPGVLTEPENVRLIKKLQGNSTGLHLSIETSGAQVERILESKQRDLFVQTLSPTLLAIVLGSSELLQHVVEAKESGGVLNNPHVMASVRIIPPTSQWMFLLEPAAVIEATTLFVPRVVLLTLVLSHYTTLEVELSNWNGVPRNGSLSLGPRPVVAAVEMRPTHFEVTVGLPVTLIEAVGVAVCNAVDQSKNGLRNST